MKDDDGLTPKQRAAVDMWLAGVPEAEIGRRLKVSRTYVGSIARRKGWTTPQKLREARLWDRARRAAYDANADMSRSIEECYREIRDRVAAGGEPWSPPK